MLFTRVSFLGGRNCFVKEVVQSVANRTLHKHIEVSHRIYLCGGGSSCDGSGSSDGISISSGSGGGRIHLTL